MKLILSFLIFTLVLCSFTAKAADVDGFLACENFAKTSAIGGYGDHMSESLNSAIPRESLQTALQSIETKMKTYYRENCQRIAGNSGFDFSAFLVASKSKCESDCPSISLGRATRNPQAVNQFDKTCKTTCATIRKDTELFRMGYLVGKSQCPAGSSNSSAGNGASRLE